MSRTIDKAAIKKVMADYLTSHGWPDLKDPDMFVLEEAENMFKILLKKNLVSYVDWDDYYAAAIVQYERAQLRKSGVDV